MYLDQYIAIKCAQCTGKGSQLVSLWVTCDRKKRNNSLILYCHHIHISETLFGSCTELEQVASIFLMCIGGWKEDDHEKDDQQEMIIFFIT